MSIPSTRTPKLLDLVAVLSAPGDSAVEPGDVGTVVEVLPPDGLEVEFLDRDGRHQPSRCVFRKRHAMTVDQLREVHRTQPFRPFTLQLADGKAVEVRHPENFSFSQRGRTIAVATFGDVIRIIDLMLVTSIEVGNGSAARRGRSRKK